MANKAVFGIAANVTQAERIADQLKAAGFSGDDISVLFPDKDKITTLAPLMLNCAPGYPFKPAASSKTSR